MAEKLVTFAQFAPATSKRLTDIERRWESLANKVASLEITVAACNAAIAELKESMDEQLTELFGQMEAAEQTLNELVGNEEDEFESEEPIDTDVPVDESELELEELPEE